MKPLPLVLLLSLAVACHQSPDAKPVSLSGGIANTFLRTYRIELRDDALLYYDGPWGDQNVQPVRIHPSKQQWKDFRNALDESRVWQWQKSYDAAVNDGTGWELKIRYGDRQIDTGGFNGYPSSFGQVAGAIEKLLGGKPFRVDPP
jgi:hypothetical protein